MKTLKIQLFTSSLLVLIICLSSCSKSYVGNISSSGITLAKAEQEEVLEEKTDEIKPLAIEKQEAVPNAKLANEPRQMAPQKIKTERVFSKKIKQVKERTAEKALAMAPSIKKASKKINNTNLKVWGIIMAASGIAAAIIVGVWLTPTIGTLAFLWMVLAIAFAFWGIFLAFLGEAYSWENRPRE